MLGRADRRYFSSRSVAQYTLVHFPDGKLIVRRSLGDLERKLESSIFFRASRGCIVNLNHVKELPDSSKMDVMFRFARLGPPRRKVVFTDAFLLQCLHIIARICVQMDGGGLLARKLIPLTRVRPLWDRARKA